MKAHPFRDIGFKVSKFQSFKINLRHYVMAAMNLASAAKERGDCAAAESAFAENLAAKRSALGADHLDTCYAALNLVAAW